MNVLKRKRFKKRQGRLWEEFVMGSHEVQFFPVNLYSSFEANFVNVVEAQPKDYDPQNPLEQQVLLEMKELVEKIFGAEIYLYLCVGLPIDFHGTDLLVVSWTTKSYVVIDLTTNPLKSYKADVLFTPRDWNNSTRMEEFCRNVSLLLEQNPDRISEEALVLLKKVSRFSEEKAP